MTSEADLFAALLAKPDLTAGLIECVLRVAISRPIREMIRLIQVRSKPTNRSQTARSSKPNAVLSSGKRKVSRADSKRLKARAEKRPS